MNDAQRASMSLRIGTALGLVVFAVAVAGAAVRAQAQTFSVGYNFGSNPNDPANPRGADAIAQGRDRNLYSTSLNGGSIGHGTAVKITPTGAVTVFVRFDNSPS